MSIEELNNLLHDHFGATGNYNSYFVSFIYLGYEKIGVTGVIKELKLEEVKTPLEAKLIITNHSRIEKVFGYYNQALALKKGLDLMSIKDPRFLPSLGELTNRI
jgi:hypothetical protein